MRVIDNSIIPTLLSPIKCLLEHLHEPLVRIAPELQEHFDKAFPKFNIEYIDSPKPILNVDVQNKHIKISVTMVEFAWVTGLAHFVIYQNYFANKKSKGGESEQIRLEDANVMALLKWAVEKLINRDGSKWPDNLPRPIPSPKFGSDEDVADEICLGACACMIHHELAHITLDHREKSNIDIEKAADNTSWEWIISSRDSLDDKQFTKRMLLLIHAFIIPVVIDIHAGMFVRGSHPPSYERLANVIEKFCPGDNSMGYAFAVSSLVLHLSNARSGVNAPQQTLPHDTFKEAFDALINHFAERFTVDKTDVKH